CGAVVNPSQVTEGWMPRRFEPAELVRGAITSNDCSCLLQLPVGIDQARADNPGGRFCFERRQQFIQPPGLRNCVVVQKYNHWSPRKRGTVVACGDEATIFRPAMHP